MHQRQFPIPAPIWLPDRKGKQNSCYHPSWSGLGEGSPIWQEGCQRQLHPVCAPLVIMLPRTSFFGALFSFQIFLQIPWHPFVFYYSSGALSSKDTNAKVNARYGVDIFYRWHLGQKSDLSDETTKARGMKENLGLWGNWGVNVSQKGLPGVWESPDWVFIAC